MPEADKRVVRLCVSAGPVLDDLEDFPHVSAFALDRAGIENVLVQAILRALVAARGALHENRSPVEIPERIGVYRERGLAGVVEYERAQLQPLEIDLVADEHEGRIFEKRSTRGPFETALWAGFKNVGWWHRSAIKSLSGYKNGS